MSIIVEIGALVLTGIGIVLAQIPILRSIIRDTMQKVLSEYERKEESQLRWEGHRREVQEIRLRYDQDLSEIKDRLTRLEERVGNNHGRR